MIYGDLVNEDGILMDDVIEICTRAVFERVELFIKNNLKKHRFVSDIEMGGHSLLYGINEAVRVGDNMIMLRNGMTVGALVIDFEMPELDTLLDAGITVVWVDCSGIIEYFVNGVNGAGLDAWEVPHSEPSMFDHVKSTPTYNTTQRGMFDF